VASGQFFLAISALESHVPCNDWNDRATAVGVRVDHVFDEVAVAFVIVRFVIVVEVAVVVWAKASVFGQQIESVPLQVIEKGFEFVCFPFGTA
jgi:hypothetical protein